MPKKLNPETPKEQAARFVAEAERMIDGGSLSLTAGARAVDLVSRAARTRKPPESVDSGRKR